MIAVVADDLAGAAEIGGVAFRYGLAAVVQSGFGTCASADIVVVDADTRSCTPEEAAWRVAGASALCGTGGVERVYKKVDSVLRGQVLAELDALIRACGRDRALLVPANPGLGRTISGGRYYVRGRPLHETDFSRDPEYPAATSEVVDLLRATVDLPVCVLRPGEPLPDRGVAVGEATCAADMVTWAQAVDDRTLPAGAAEFFGAFLQVGGYCPAPRVSSAACLSAHDTALFVCGSTSETSHSFCAWCQAHGIPVLRMPAELLDAPPAARQRIDAHVHRWAGEVVRALETHARAMVAIDLPLRREPGVPQALSGYLGAAVQEVLTRHPVDHLFAEGGATAVSLIRRFGWERLRVRCEFAPGVVCMQIEGADGPLVTMKPGSYAWPDQVLTLP